MYANGALRLKMTSVLRRWSPESSRATCGQPRSCPTSARTRRSGQSSQTPALKPRPSSIALPAAARASHSRRPIAHASSMVAAMFMVLKIAMNTNGSPPRSAVAIATNRLKNQT